MAQQTTIPKLQLVARQLTMATFCLRFQKQGERVLLRCEKAMAELHLIGQIIGGTEFAEKSICCRWQLSSGNL